jgi:hypothetical protein
MDMFGSTLAGWGRPVENQEGASLGALLFFLPQLSISACDVGCAPPLRQSSNSANLKLSIGCVVHAVALRLKIYFSASSASSASPLRFVDHSFEIVDPFLVFGWHLGLHMGAKVVFSFIKKTDWSGHI